MRKRRKKNAAVEKRCWGGEWLGWGGLERGV